jgi:hypothetical protein
VLGILEGRAARIERWYPGHAGLWWRRLVPAQLRRAGGPP